MVSTDLLGLRQQDDVSYTPSIPTDFSGYLPDFSADEDLGIAEGYNPESVVQAAWKSLATEVPKLPWERNFWDKFLDTNVSAKDMLERGYKRPMPAPFRQDSQSAPSAEVERRVFPKPSQAVKGFLQHVRDIPERSWQEEREAVWETAVRRWVALTDGNFCLQTILSLWRTKQGYCIAWSVPPILFSTLALPLPTRPSSFARTRNLWKPILTHF